MTSIPCTLVTYHGKMPFGVWLPCSVQTKWVQPSSVPVLNSASCFYGAIFAVITARWADWCSQFPRNSVSLTFTAWGHLRCCSSKIGRLVAASSPLIFRGREAVNPPVSSNKEGGELSPFWQLDGFGLDWVLFFFHYSHFC